MIKACTLKPVCDHYQRDEKLDLATTILRILYAVVLGMFLFKGLNNVMAGVWLGMLLYLPAALPARLTIWLLKELHGLLAPQQKNNPHRRPLP